MKTYKSIHDYSPKGKTLITIGTFDGVHLGHQKILKKLVAQAKQFDLEATILTFFPHPRMVLQQDSSIRLLNTIEEKSLLLEQIGIRHLIVQEFTQEFSRQTALEYVRDVLVNQLQIAKIMIGYDHRFGRNRTANIQDLREYGDLYDFEVEEITAKEIGEVAVSSTKVRNALIRGDIHTANTYLGYDYFLTGTVLSGKALGRTIGFPTANIYIEKVYKLIPAHGVYVIYSYIEGVLVFGMMNIGYNPTVADGDTHVEVHFFDFKGDLYHMELQIHCIARVRDEQKFENVEALQEQLAKDQMYCKTILQQYSLPSKEE
ncbi:MAG: bifunctional riboflavin kinase/FAD synthetase [Flavobacteriaceae bacterium]|nr:bifunctional riboflavin kinase/FAD synthetase [Flavobacteriaceae bacterium]